MYNALAAIAVAWRCGIRAETAARGLGSFHGAGRRLEFKGTYRGADVYDDYAHHPGELHALIAAVKCLDYRRILCAFQPHTYTRTKALFDDFVRELRQVDVAEYRRRFLSGPGCADSRCSVLRVAPGCDFLPAKGGPAGRSHPDCRCR